MNFTIGADPEFFLCDKDGNLKSAVPIIEGTKHKQLLVEGGGLQRDNVAAEFSCNPSNSEDEFVSSIGNMLKQLNGHIRGLRLVALASADFPKEELSHEEARRFGCDPDFDAYELAMNVVAPGAEESTFRSCGGHIHIGMKNGYPKCLAEDEDGMGRVRMVKAMDIFVGIPSVCIDPDKSAAPRRSLYGKAGAHRPKNYGVEYRASGNFWTKSPSLVRAICRLTQAAVEATESGKDNELLEAIGPEEIQRVINSSDSKAALKLTKKYVYPLLSKETIELVESVRGTEFDIYKEWGI